MKTNDQVRQLIADKGISSENVTVEQLALLHTELSSSLASSDCFNGTFAMNEITDPKYMTCCCDLWGEREAVSFNRDGFVGFCGWASSSNTLPIVNGVCNWLDKL